MNWETSGGPGTTKASEDRQQQSHTPQADRQTHEMQAGNKLEASGKPGTTTQEEPHTSLKKSRNQKVNCSGSKQKQN